MDDESLANCGLHRYINVVAIQTDSWFYKRRHVTKLLKACLLGLNIILKPWLCFECNNLFLVLFNASNFIFVNHFCFVNVQHNFYRHVITVYNKQRLMEITVVVNSSISAANPTTKALLTYLSFIEIIYNLQRFVYSRIDYNRWVCMISIIISYYKCCLISISTFNKIIIISRSRDEC